MMEFLIQVEKPREGRKLRAAWFLFQTWVPVLCTASAAPPDLSPHSKCSERTLAAGLRRSFQRCLLLSD